MNRTSSELSTRSQQEWLQDIFYSAIENGYSTALWRLPNSATFHVLVAEEAERITSEKTLEEMTYGFVFAPFDKSRDRIFLKGDYVFSFENNDPIPQSNPTKEDLPWLRKQSKLTVSKKVGHENPNPKNRTRRLTLKRWLKKVSPQFIRVLLKRW